MNISVQNFGFNKNSSSDRRPLQKTDIAQKNRMQKAMCWDTDVGQNNTNRRRKEEKRSKKTT